MKKEPPITTVALERLAPFERCQKLVERGEFELAEKYFREAIAADPFDRSMLLGYALMKRLDDSREEALQILNHCERVFGSDAEILAMRAQIELERGGNAIPIYEQLVAVDPRNGNFKLGLATAIAAEGDLESAVTLLMHALEQDPEWLEGQNLLAKLRWECGDATTFDDGYKRAMNRLSNSQPLCFAHCGLLASGQHYERLAIAVESARQRYGEHPLFDMFEAQAASETGDTARAKALFAKIGPIHDYSFAAVKMRALLRAGRADSAAEVGKPFLNEAGANFIWPLMALAWRQCDERRWRWLERFETTVRMLELGMTDDALDRLAAKLRILHAAKAHPMDLSARKGTQTRLNLLERSDPEFVDLRKAIRQAVRIYLDGLPKAEHDHPFLSPPRRNFRFAGSWSIRLGAAGHHVSHVHPAGWISSALYITVPEKLRANRREGWLAMGGAPPELGLNLPAVRHFEPKRGRLVLFPSIMWHGTEPFESGERMSIAFDIAPFSA